MDDADRKKFHDHLEWAAKQVASWPAWKRNILKDSSKPQWDTPRKPQDNR